MTYVIRIDYRDGDVRYLQTHGWGRWYLTDDASEAKRYSRRRVHPDLWDLRRVLVENKHAFRRVVAAEAPPRRVAYPAGLVL